MGDITYSCNDDGTATVMPKGYNQYYSGNITIPSEVEYLKKTYTVTGIGDDAFKDCKELTSITIPEGVTGIGEKAFYLCTGLTSIEIPNSVTSIGKYAFSGCAKQDSATGGSITGLTSVTFEPDSELTSIGEKAFSECIALTSITIPEGVESIEKNTFFGCTVLTSVTIPSSVTSIGAMAFQECKALTSVTIPNKVASIEKQTFCKCTNLKSITIPNSVEKIGENAFGECNNLTTVIYEGLEDQWNDSGLNTKLSVPPIFISVKLEATKITYDSVELKAGIKKPDDKLTEIKAQYRMNSGSWQDSSVFEGLKADTEYTFEAGYFKGDTQITNAVSTVIRTAKKTPSYTPPANPAIDITGKEGGTVIYDRIKHTVTITPADNYLVKEITLNGTTIPVTDGAMVLENIYGWSRISVTFEPKPEPAFEPDKYVGELKFKANSSKTSKGNIRIKVTSITDDNGNKIDLTELKDKGYTVKFKYYRSTKKASEYTAKVEKDVDINSYINTSGKKGTKYYYKVRVMVYDADGNLVAKSDLKQCSYAARIWSK